MIVVSVLYIWSSPTVSVVFVVVVSFIRNVNKREIKNCELWVVFNRRRSIPRARGDARSIIDKCFPLLSSSGSCRSVTQPLSSQLALGTQSRRVYRLLHDLRCCQQLCDEATNLPMFQQEGIVALRAADESEHGMW